MVSRTFWTKGADQSSRLKYIATWKSRLRFPTAPAGAIAQYDSPSPLLGVAEMHFVRLHRRGVQLGVASFVWSAVRGKVSFPLGGFAGLVFWVSSVNFVVSSKSLARRLHLLTYSHPHNSLTRFDSLAKSRLCFLNHIMQIGIRSAYFLLKSTFSASPIGAGWSICIARLAGAGSNNSGPSPIHDVPILGATLAGEKTWPRLAGGCEWSCTSRPVTVDYSCHGHRIRASPFLPLPNFMKPDEGGDRVFSIVALKP